MKKIVLLLVPCIFLCSCSAMIQSMSVGKEYLNRTFLDKKIVIVPFSRDQMTFALKHSQERFDSLNALCSGRLDDSASSAFAAAILGGLETINGISPEWTDGQKTAYFQAIKDTAKMVEVIKTSGQKKVKMFVPGRPAIMELAPDANMVCYVQETGIKKNSNDQPTYFMDFIIYDYDSSRIVSTGSVTPDFSGLGLIEQAKMSPRKVDTWLAWASRLANPILTRSPFTIQSSPFDPRVRLDATYSKIFLLSKEIDVKVKSSKYDIRLINGADKKTKLWIADSLINPKIKALTSAIKDFALPRLSGVEEKDRLNQSGPLCGMVTYKGWITGNRTPVFQKFNSNIKDTAFAALVDKFFCPVDAAATGSESTDGATFMLPIAISVAPPESQGNYYFNPNQFMPKNQFKPPPIPRF
jgi:hypothetical protein